MLKPTHSDASTLSANITSLLYVITFKFVHVSVFKQICMFVIFYLAMRFISEESGKVPDADQALEASPMKNLIGYLVGAYAHSVGAVHRRYPFHCITFYLTRVTPFILITLMLYLITWEPLVLLIFFLILGCLNSLLMHMLMDLISAESVMLTRRKVYNPEKIRNYYKQITLYVRYGIPFFSISKRKLSYDERISGGEFELAMRLNVNVINLFVSRVLVFVCVTDFRQLFSVFKYVIR